jgi:K+-sensing histidine kinase KdpD
MSDENRITPNVGHAQRMLTIQNQALQAGNIDDLSQGVLPDIAALVDSDSALIYIQPTDSFYQHGFPTDDIQKLESLCPDQMDKLNEQDMFFVSSTDFWKPKAKLALHALRQNGSSLGFVGLMQTEADFPIDQPRWQGLLNSIAKTIHNQIQISQLQQQVNQLNTYMSVSSMLAQPLGLHDMLEAALYCCMEATSAQAASVLLLGENKENFHFYQVAGPAKPVLDAATFPIGEGIAGSVLRSQESEVINNVQGDARFYGKFDSKSEFQTLNMIAIPLTAGEEKVGVLEVINKIDDLDFTEDERLSLMMIAEEIAFAIHNARIFEYVVNSYCLIRQGQHSCRGCERPLGSWTPCVRYRENITVLNMKSPLNE